MSSPSNFCAHPLLAVAKLVCNMSSQRYRHPVSIPTRLNDIHCLLAAVSTSEMAYSTLPSSHHMILWPLGVWPHS
eukprot:353477-Chlamydomonas_euryale.AAC.2